MEEDDESKWKRNKKESKIIEKQKGGKETGDDKAEKDKKAE